MFVFCCWSHFTFFSCSVNTRHTYFEWCSCDIVVGCMKIHMFISWYICDSLSHQILFSWRRCLYLVTNLHVFIYTQMGLGTCVSSTLTHTMSNIVVDYSHDFFCINYRLMQMRRQQSDSNHFVWKWNKIKMMTGCISEEKETYLRKIAQKS